MFLNKFAAVLVASSMALSSFVYAQDDAAKEPAEEGLSAATAAAIGLGVAVIALANDDNDLPKGTTPPAGGGDTGGGDGGDGGTDGGDGGTDTTTDTGTSGTEATGSTGSTSST